jgi:uncharacterized membrane protein
MNIRHATGLPSTGSSRMSAEENPNTRLLAFSDGVVAVAITLLVLDIRLPEGFGELGDAELWQQIVALKPKLIAYLISFFVIGRFWMSHRAQFERIEKTDANLMWLNMLFLLTIGIVPFNGNLIAESHGALATILYAGTMMVSGLSLTAIWQYAVSKKFTDPKLTREEALAYPIGGVLIALIFLLSMPIALYDAEWAKFFWILIWPVNFAAARWSSRR